MSRIRKKMGKKILFVDDEAAILKAIRREFMDSDYTSFYAISGQDALAILYENKIDVIVSDMRMPSMDGYQLLQKVKYLYPDTIRIILSGYADKDLLFKTISKNIAKINIVKPWKSDELLNAINDVFNTYEILNNDKIKDFLKSSQSLYTLQVLFSEVNRLIDDDASSLDDLVKVINRDQTMTAKILNTVNSAYYGIKTGSIKTAIAQLGYLNIKSIIAAIALFDNDTNSYYKELLWNHTSLVNTFTIQIYEKLLKKKIPDTYLTAGLLHDIGKVIFYRISENKYENIVKMRDENQKIPVDVCEKNIFGYTHEEIGAYILNWWEMPAAMIETALHHNNPSASSKINREIVSVVHIADYYSWKAIYPKFIPVLYDYTFKELNISKNECEKLLKTIK